MARELKPPSSQCRLLEVQPDPVLAHGLHNHGNVRMSSIGVK